MDDVVTEDLLPTERRHALILSSILDPFILSVRVVLLQSYGVG